MGPLAHNEIQTPNKHDCTEHEIESIKKKKKKKYTFRTEMYNAHRLLETDWFVNFVWGKKKKKKKLVELKDWLTTLFGVGFRTSNNN